MDAEITRNHSASAQTELRGDPLPLGSAAEVRSIWPPETARAAGLVVRRVILRLTSKPTSMGWLHQRVYGHTGVFDGHGGVWAGQWR